MAPLRLRVPIRYTLAKPGERNGTNPCLGRELLTALGSTTLDRRPPRAGTHPHTEAVLALTAPLVGLIGTFHVR
jgi:hypothetical protein